MKRSKAETLETRKRILDIAAKAFKNNGIQGTGVAEIMAAAGMTHGGFYRHFASKEQLVAEACASSMNTLVESAKVASESGSKGFLKHLEDFLSAEYRDDTLSGCPLVAMGSEIARSDADTRRAASQGFEQLIEIVSEWMRAKDSSLARADAIFTLSSMIGAVTMSRIIDDPDLSDQILETAKEHLTILASNPIEKHRTAESSP